MSRAFAAGAIVLAVAVATAAAGKAAPTKLTLSVQQRTDRPTQIRLVARLDGGAVRAGRSVAFFVVSTEFGTYKLPIGTAAVGANGTASIVYRPTWSGNQRFVAKLVGSHARTVTADYRVTASIPGSLYAGANPGRPLGSVGGVFLDVILTVVALVWLSLIVVLVLAIARLPRLAGGGID